MDEKISVHPSFDIFCYTKGLAHNKFLPSRNPLSPMKSALQNLESSLLKSIKKMPWEKKSIKPINLLESSRLKSIKKMPSKKIIKNYINNLMKQNFYRKFWHEKDIVCYLLHV